MDPTHRDIGLSLLSNSTLVMSPTATNISRERDVSALYLWKGPEWSPTDRTWSFRSQVTVHDLTFPSTVLITSFAAMAQSCTHTARWMLKHVLGAGQSHSNKWISSLEDDICRATFLENRPKAEIQIVTEIGSIIWTVRVREARRTINPMSKYGRRILRGEGLWISLQTHIKTNKKSFMWLAGS